MSETILISEQRNAVVVNEDGATVISVAAQGPPGPPGVSGDKHFEQAFTGLSTITVTHNLGKKPAVTVIDSTGEEVIGDISFIDNNTVTVSFSASFSGTVLCN